MQNQGTPAIDYQALAKSGLQMPEGSFALVRDSLITGAEAAKKYLNITDDSWPKFNFSNDIATLGYSAKDDAICLSISQLNQAAAHSTPLEYKDQLLMFMPDIFYIIIKYTFWLKLLGIEATIHRYQKVGNPLLHIQFPESLPHEFSSRLLLLSNIEVEARTTTDTIVQQLGETPIWKNVDTYFSKNYPQYYNKSIEELLKLPKPQFQFSFEMEYYT